MRCRGGQWKNLLMEGPQEDLWENNGNCRRATMTMRDSRIMHLCTYNTPTGSSIISKKIFKVKTFTMTQKPFKGIMVLKGFPQGTAQCVPGLDERFKTCDTV
ncbi:uncharacterized protein LOC116813437 isoform X1 [Hylobates moloch]|uniref:uncharacterized protein LOC116813437 isoform X1 n=1 Tax=Hylobates moloch TaxID=81572 RepID=UPI0013F2888A|nr:uncharacterized protein LOC116813437 isoform X1 [Hylobates moloch]